MCLIGNSRGAGTIRIRKGLFIFLLIFAFTAGAIAIFAVSQWDNIQAAIIGLQKTPEEIEALHTDAKQSFEQQTGIDLSQIEELSKHIHPDGTPIDSSESASEPDKVEIPSVPQAPETPLNGTSNGTAQNAPQNPTIAQNTKEVEKILARFYALQSSYVSQIEGIKDSAYAQYEALPQSKRGTSDKIRIGRAAVAQATSLENQCDAQVASLVSELRAALKKANMAPSLASEVEYYYASQKSYLKASYMSKFSKYLS